MNITATVLSSVVSALVMPPPMLSQVSAETRGNVPLYKVTVVQRSVDAINYQYRSGPTMIDFAGTTLLPKAKGSAVVESLRGRTNIEAKLQDMPEPTRFGREYLTYVLWAITPEGAPHNVAEIIPGPSDNAKFHVTTDLQAFGLIVTAEPYSTVRVPSNVAVLENRVRPDTVGKVIPIQVKYGLMPRGEYTYQVPEGPVRANASAPKVSMSQYEAQLELYQAQNAIAIACSQGADRYAADTIARARQLHAEAQRLMAGKGDRKLVVREARAASQTAEDARVITERSKQEQQLADARAQVVAAEQARNQAQAQAQQAKAEAEAARAQAEAERRGREAVERQAAPPQAEVQPTVPPSSGKGRFRGQLLEHLNGALPVRDTPRGLVATVPDTVFNNEVPDSVALTEIAKVASTLARYPGLRVMVEGYSDSAATQGLCWKRAAAVRAQLTAHGLNPSVVTARSLGTSRPVASNDSESGRIENRRVEIVISGDEIGTLPSWDRMYSLRR